MNHFKAYKVYQRDDGIEGRIENVSLDDLSAGEVIIQAEYSSVNYKDALAATGKGKIIRHFPLIAGIDVAGKVIESQEDRFKTGDEVLVTGYEFGTGHDGGYSEICRAPADWVVKLPAGFTSYQAMALGTAGFTAALCMQRLEDNHQSPDKGPFIITGASGGVGMVAIDILDKCGYEVVALSGKPELSEKLTSLGAKQIIDRTTLSFDGPPLDKGQWGGAIDNVGGDVLGWLTRTVVPWGNIASVGLAGGAHLKTTVMPFILRGVSLIGITSSGCPSPLREQIWQRLATDLAPRHLDKIVSQVVSMEQLPNVFDAMLAGKTSGRTIVKIGKDK